MSGRYFSNIVFIHFFNAPSLEKPENQKHHNMVWILLLRLKGGYFWSVWGFEQKVGKNWLIS